MTEQLYSDKQYIGYDPFDGDRDTDVKMRTVKIVKGRKDYKCFGLTASTPPHVIKAGERMRYERALVDGDWCDYRVCLNCMNEWFKEIGI